MEHFAILNAELVSTELDLYAGNIVLMASVMMVLSAISLKLMDVELDMQFGMKTNVTGKMLILVVKSGVPFGTLNAEQTSTMSLAVSAHQIVLLVRPISVSHVQKIPTVVEQGFHLSVHQALR